MAESRKLAAILAADVVGFSRLTGADEDRTLARLRALRSDLIDPAISVHNGRVVKRTGDGAIVEFRSVVDAVRCAIEIQNGMVERNAGLPEDRRIDFRIGVHLGDVVEESDGDLMGDGVNIAARLEGVAQPGAICLSEDAYRQVKARLGLAVTDLGPTHLKNIAEPVRAYSLRVGPPPPAKPETPEERPAEAKPLALPDRPSIAVLAFQTMGGDAEQEYFADGMVEDIITGLSRIKWLFVIARNSSFAYKGKSVDIRQVAHELGVRYVLEGSVRKAGGRLRVNAQLIDADNGAHVWADRYDGALDDVFDFQDRITETIVGIIEPNVRRAEIERARRKRPDSLDAYDLYLQAASHFGSMMPEEAENAIPLLEQALKLDPHYAPAHALMALALETRFARGGYRKADAESSERHARAAVAYGADDSTALAMASLPLMMVAHDFEAASSAVKRALDINPSCAFALFFGGQAQAYGGDHALAEDYATRALRLSPLDPQSFMALNALGFVRGLAGRLDEAVSFFTKAVQANPRFSTLYIFQAAALAHAGRPEEAATAASRLIAMQPDFRVAPFRQFASGFCRKDMIDWLSAGLLKAGLPE
jgi:TolB-like protein/class 3 adenylate cyclase/Tfp pilus assembly protein PilF